MRMPTVYVNDSENAMVQENAEVNPPEPNPGISPSKQSISTTSVSSQKLSVAKSQRGAKSDGSFQTSGPRPSTLSVSSILEIQGGKRAQTYHLKLHIYEES